MAGTPEDVSLAPQESSRDPELEHQLLFAQRTERMKPSVIRGLLALAERSDILSFAGGLPCPDTFPSLEVYQELFSKAHREFGSRMSQYGETIGFRPFRETLQQWLPRQGVLVQGLENIMVTVGSQQALDLIGKVFIDPGDYIAVESPTYLGAIQAFDPYGPKYAEIETDENGVIPESLEDLLKVGNIKFAYLIPTFQNPTGRTIPDDRRKAIAEILKRHKTLLVEDDPYSQIRFSGIPVAPIQQYAPENTILLNTASKILSPGWRIGMVTAPKEIIDKLVVAQQGTLLHPPVLTQALATIYFRDGHFEAQLPKTRKLYGQHCQTMLQAMQEFFPSSVRWTRPEGGIFVWVTLPDGSDAEKIFSKAIDQKVAFVPGMPFFVNPEKGINTMRLNFSNQSDENIVEGMRRLGSVLHAESRLFASSF